MGHRYGDQLLENNFIETNDGTRTLSRKVTRCYTSVSRLNLYSIRYCSRRREEETYSRCGNFWRDYSWKGSAVSYVDLLSLLRRLISVLDRVERRNWSGPFDVIRSRSEEGRKGETRGCCWGNTTFRGRTRSTIIAARARARGGGAGRRCR